MYEIKSAQLKHVLSLTKEQTLKFLKQIDVDGISQEKDFLGYSPLHFAVEYHSLKLANELLGLGANFLKQEPCHQKTPLHLVINKIDYNDKKIFFFKDRQELADALLSAHVLTANASNPKSNDGVSHFHIACLFNHLEAIDFFINAGELINQVTNIRYTPLHCAVKSSSVDAIKILLTHGADINLKDAKGMSSLDVIAELCIEANDMMTVGKQISTLFYEDDIKWIESIFIFILELVMNDSIFLDNSGLTDVHLTCMLKDKSAVKSFLNKGHDFNKPIPMDSKIWPGWVPLHFAACCNVETVELLLQNGININVRNVKGETPFDSCAMRYTPATVAQVLSGKNEFESILFSDGSTKLLDLLQTMNNYDEFNGIISNLIDINISVSLDSKLWPGYSILHLCVLMNEKAKNLDEYLSLLKLVKPIDSTVERYNCTEEEIELYMKRIDACLERGSSVSTKNAEGLTPIHLAFKMQKISVVKKLLNYCQEDTVDPHGLSHFHIACVVGNKNAVELLLSKGMKISNPVKHSFKSIKLCYIRGYAFDELNSIESVIIKSTPLHIAIIFGHDGVTKYLVEKGADVLAKDARGLTPIHLSMRSSWHVVECLLDRALKDSSSLKEVTFPEHFSYLFVAARADDGKAIEKLLQNGTHVDVRFPKGEIFESDAAGLTPLHVAVEMESQNAVGALIEGGANIFAENPDRSHDSPLQRVIQKVNRELYQPFAKYLKHNAASMGPLDSSGLTQLHFACINVDLDWATELLAKGANVNATASWTNAKVYNITWLTPLLLLLDWGTTILATPNFMNLLQLLLQEGADVTIGNQEGDTPLHLAYYKYLQQKRNEPVTNNDYYFDEDEIEDEPLPFLHIADMLLKSQKSFIINPVNNCGFSHFHYACLRNDVEIVRKFLDNAIDVNHITSSSDGRNDHPSPLHCAIAYRSEGVIPLLIECGADLKAEYVNGNTPLHVAIINFVNLQLIDTLIRHGADINARNLAGDTPMRLLLNAKSLTSEKLKFFIDRGAEIDVSNGESTSEIFDDAIRNAVPNDVISIFKTLLKAFGIDRATEIGFNAIHSLVTDYSEDRTLDFYLDAIRQVMELGCGLNWQNEHGETALHIASKEFVHEAVEALLILGADVNIIDEKDNSSLTREMVELVEIDFCDELGANYLSTIKTFVTHFWKMKLVQLDVVNSYAIAAQLAENTWNFDANCKNTFQEELMKIEGKKIGQTVPVKSFLSEWGAIVNYPMMSFIQREAVDIYFRNFDSLRREFPELCGLLMMQYRKALDRVDLLKFAKHVIISEYEVNLPDLCLEGIFKYFNNNDLKILIADTSEILNPCKRRKIS